MKNIIRFILRLVQNPIVLAILWFGVAIRGFWVSWTEGLALVCPEKSCGQIPDMQSLQPEVYG